MKIKIDLSRQGNFIFAILMIHFLFFGVICNIYLKSIGEDIIFINKILFNPVSFFSLIILIGIIFFMVFRENFYEYGIRNSIWLTPIIIGESWIWSWFINGFNIAIIGVFFINLDGYLTILSLLSINVLTAILAGYTKLKYQEYLKRIKKLDIEKNRLKEN